MKILQKHEALEIIKLLSALESWSFSANIALPDYLRDALSESIGVLSEVVVGKEAKQSYVNGADHVATLPKTDITQTNDSTALSPFGNAIIRSEKSLYPTTQEVFVNSRGNITT